LEVDLKRHKAVRSGAPLNLTPKEFLLAHLIRRAQQQKSSLNLLKFRDLSEPTQGAPYFILVYLMATGKVFKTHVLESGPLQ
jgi:hypothetical protein